jgi:hypothetical protein
MPVGSTLFRAVNLEVPTSRGEAKEMALEILSKQKDILKVNVSVVTSDSQTNLISYSLTFASSISGPSLR